MRFFEISLCSLLLLVSAEIFGQSANFPNNFTPKGKVPPGCLIVTPSSIAVPTETLLLSGIVEVFDPLAVPANVEIRVWRIGCHEPDRSAIAVNFRFDSMVTNSIGLPVIRIAPADSPNPATGSTLSFFSNKSLGSSVFSLASPLLAPISASFLDGVTLILDSADSDISVDQYNGFIDMEIQFTGGQTFTASLAGYDPSRDLSQLLESPFHGRFSGQWVVDGLPASGLLLQIGEVPGTDRNFIFAIWFTYIDGFPTWVVGNTDFEIGSSEIVLDMSFIEGGEFFTQPGSFTQDDILASPVGTMTIRANHCNEIEADLDFTEIGEGTANLTFNRLIRIAGYDCDQTQ